MQALKGRIDKEIARHVLYTGFAVQQLYSQLFIIYWLMREKISIPAVLVLIGTTLGLF